MSDFSIIAHDYALNAEFARSFNESVLNLKRFYLLGRSTDIAAEQSIDNSRENLRQMLESLLLGLEDAGKPWSEQQAQVPADVIDRVRSREKGDLPETVELLREVAKALATKSCLGSSEFATLDRVCEAADATASAAFRRLRRI